MDPGRAGDYGLWIMDYRLPPRIKGLWIMDYRLPPRIKGLWIMNYRLPPRIKGLWVMGPAMSGHVQLCLGMAGHGRFRARMSS